MQGTALVKEVTAQGVRLAWNTWEDPPAPAPVALVLAMPRPRVLRRLWRQIAEMGARSLRLRPQRQQLCSRTSPPPPAAAFQYHVPYQKLTCRCSEGARVLHGRRCAEPAGATRAVHGGMQDMST